MPLPTPRFPTPRSAGAGIPASAKSDLPTSGRAIPEATVARLPVYHRVLVSLSDRGVVTVSSQELASACGVTSAKLRKDLSYLGSYGTRGVGYEVEFLSYQIARELGLTNPWGVVVVGVGNLGKALVSYRGFASRGFEVVALIDSHPDVVGSTVSVVDREIVVDPLDRLDEVVSERKAHIGVITTPADAAQDVADRMVGAGLRSIVNFAPVVLNVPDDVDVRKVDLAVELQVLAFHEQRRRNPAGGVVTDIGAQNPSTIVDGDHGELPNPDDRQASKAMNA